MTVTADDKKRVVLPGAKPGDCFQVEQQGNEYHLTKMVPAPKTSKVRLVKENGYLVAVGDRMITEEEVRAALNEFP